MRIFKGSFAVIVNNKKLLVGKRQMEPFKGMYWFLGGLIEKDETAEDAVVREVKEESGFDIEIKNYFGIIKTKYKDAFYHTSIFKAEIIGGEENIQEKEIEDIKWMNIDDFIENLRRYKFPEDKIKILLGFIYDC